MLVQEPRAAPAPPSEPTPRASTRRPRPRRPGRRAVRRGAYAAVAVGLVTLAVGALRPSPIEVETAAASVGPLETVVAEEGETRVADRYLVTAPVAGRLRRIVAREGDRVAVGERVASIEPAPVDPRTLAAALAGIRAAESRLTAASVRLEQAEAAAAQAERELPRQRTLIAAGAISVEEMERLELAAAGAIRERDVARSAERAAAAELAAARAAVLGAGDGAAGTVDVRAPAGGRLLRLHERSARHVAAGEPLAEIGSVDGVEVVADVLSSDAVRIREGMPVRVEQWGGARALTGRVQRVEPAAFPRTSALGVEERRVHVIVTLDAAPPRLGAGFRVEARIVTWSSPAVLQVPTAALVQRDDGWRVFRIVDGVARERRVQIGARGEEAVEVRAGLGPGEEVILYPADEVAEGVRVRRAVR